MFCFVLRTKVLSRDVSDEEITALASPLLTICMCDLQRPNVKQIALTHRKLFQHEKVLLPKLKQM